MTPTAVMAQTANDINSLVASTWHQCMPLRDARLQIKEWVETLLTHRPPTTPEERAETEYRLHAFLYPEPFTSYRYRGVPLLDARTLPGGISHLTRTARKEAKVQGFVCCRVDGSVLDNADDTLGQLAMLIEGYIGPGRRKASLERSESSSFAGHRSTVTRALNRWATEGRNKSFLLTIENPGSWINDPEERRRLVYVVNKWDWLSIFIAASPPDALVPDDTSHRRGSYPKRIYACLRRGSSWTSAYKRLHERAIQPGRKAVRILNADLAAYAERPAWRMAVNPRYRDIYVFPMKGNDEYHRSFEQDTARDALMALAHDAGIGLDLARLRDYHDITFSGLPKLQDLGVEKVTFRRWGEELEVQVCGSAYSLDERRGQAGQWPQMKESDTPLPDTIFHTPGIAGLQCMRYVFRLLGDTDADEAQLRRRYEVLSGNWDGGQLQGKFVRDLFQAHEPDALVVHSPGKVALACETGAKALLFLSEGHFGDHALVRDGNRLFDPQGFHPNGIGQKWLQGTAGVTLDWAVILPTTEAAREVLDVSSGFARKYRPDRAYRKRSIPRVWRRHNT